jgi:hypothetical protein
MKPFRKTLLSALCFGALASVSVPAFAELNWAEEAAGAAAGYCLARHPYIELPNGETYTSEGFEVVASPGVAGAVRRNYVFNRPQVDLSQRVPIDVGQEQTCAQACVQWGYEYAGDPKLVAKPLHIRRKPGDQPMPDGVDDMASSAHFDTDFFTYQRRVVAGISGRPGQTSEGVGAQSDFCCCQMRFQ